MDRTARVEEIAKLIETDQWDRFGGVVAYADKYKIHREEVVDLVSDAFGLMVRRTTFRAEVQYRMYHYLLGLVDKAARQMKNETDKDAVDPTVHKQAIEAVKQLVHLTQAQTKAEIDVTHRLAATPQQAAALVKESFRKPAKDVPEKS